MVIQSDLSSIYQGRGYAGAVAREVPQNIFEEVKAGVPNNGANLQPGWGVFWSGTNNDVREPTSDAEELAVIGIVGYTYGSATSQLATTPANANSDKRIEFKNDEVIRICIEGYMYLRAGEALKKFDRLRFDRADNNWQKITTPTTVPNIAQLSVSCMDDSVADGGLFAAKIQLNALR